MSVKTKRYFWGSVILAGAVAGAFGFGFKAGKQQMEPVFIDTSSNYLTVRSGKVIPLERIAQGQQLVPKPIADYFRKNYETLKLPPSPYDLRMSMSKDGQIYCAKLAQRYDAAPKKQKKATGGGW